MARGFFSGIIIGGALSGVLLSGVSVYVDYRAALRDVAVLDVVEKEPASAESSDGAPKRTVQDAAASVTTPAPILAAPQTAPAAPLIDTSPGIAVGAAGSGPAGIAIARAPAQPLMQTPPVIIAPGAPSLAPAAAPDTLDAAPANDTKIRGARLAPDAAAPIGTDHTPDGAAVLDKPASTQEIVQPSTPEVQEIAAPDTGDNKAVVAPLPLPEPDASMSPLTEFSEPFSNPEGKPEMAIILIDDGQIPTGSSIGLTALRSFRFPLTIAVDTRLDDAGARMMRHRAEGYEVLAFTRIDAPWNAQSAARLDAVFSAMPQTVGALAAPGMIPPEAVNYFAKSGRALVAQLPEGSALPSATQVFRDLDQNGETPNVIRRFLDQSAFRAGQKSGVVTLGRLRTDTITALLIWGLQNSVKRVALAPISAVVTPDKG